MGLFFNNSQFNPMANQQQNMMNPLLAAIMNSRPQYGQTNNFGLLGSLSPLYQNNANTNPMTRPMPMPQKPAPMMGGIRPEPGAATSMPGQMGAGAGMSLPAMQNQAFPNIRNAISQRLPMNPMAYNKALQPMNRPMGFMAKPQM